MTIARDVFEDFCVLLRNSLSDPASRPSNTTGTWVASNEATFSFANSGVKNVRSVTLDGVSKLLRTDYTVDYFNGELEFVSPVTGTAIADYDYGSTWIFREYPRLEDATMPRISITQLGPAEDVLTIGNSKILYRLRHQVDIWCDYPTSYTISGETFLGPKLRDKLTDDVVEIIKDNRDWIPNVIDSRVVAVDRSMEEIERETKKVRRLWHSRINITNDYFYNNV